MKPEMGGGNVIPALFRSGSRGRGRPSMLPLNEEAGRCKPRLSIAMNVYWDEKLEITICTSKGRQHTEAERDSGMANGACSAMMLLPHQPVASAEGYVAEHVHVSVVPKALPGTGPLCRRTGPLFGRHGNGLRTSGARGRVVNAMNGHQRHQMSDSRWEEGRESVHGGVLGLGLDEGYYKLVEESLRYMGEAEWMAGRTLGGPQLPEGGPGGPGEPDG